MPGARYLLHERRPKHSEFYLDRELNPGHTKTTAAEALNNHPRDITTIYGIRL